MSVKSISVFSYVIFNILSFLPIEGLSQAREKIQANNDLQPSDTIEYIPSWYYGALDYNLMIAASKGLTIEIDRLIELGANINSYTDEGATPLVLAVANNHYETVKTLLKHFPSLDDITSEGETPLLISVKNGSSEIAEILLRAGADIDFNDNYGVSSLHYAALSGFLELTDLLLYYDASIDLKTDDGFTSLHTATLAGHIDVADLLIQNGANMESRDNEGYTPFLIAASFGDTLIMEMLYNYGVDIFTRNNYNHNALTLSIAFGYKEAVNYLLRKSDRWKDADNLGHDPYKIVAKYGRREIEALLKENGIPGKVKFAINQVSLSGSARFTAHDYYSGFNLSVREPYLNAGFSTGLDVKLWYTRILLKNSETSFNQYLDRGAMFYAGFFKDFSLTNRIERGNLILSTSLSGGYTFGNKFKGTMITPDNSFKIIPCATLKYTKNAISAFSGIEYIKSDYYKIGPVWFRVGISYNYYFDNLMTRQKKIRWK
jgi:ankyrin repeat protein